MTVKLKKDEVKYLSDLSNISLTDTEADKITDQLKETLDYVKNLKEVKVESSESIYSASGLESVFFEDGQINKRQLSQSEALKNAKNCYKGFFRVPKML